MARLRSQGYAAGTSTPPLKTDIQAPRLLIARLLPVYPQPPDVAGTPGERLNLTQRRPTGDEAYGHQA